MLDETGHRPWPLPSRAWAMAMSWHELLFAHWPVAASDVRRLLPDGLEVDTFDGSAWIGVVPFGMSGVRLRGTPALPGVSTFAEVNVRTYVRAGGKPGVWFFSLDAASAMMVRLARAWFHLPYFHARMRLVLQAGAVRYSSSRIQPRSPEAGLEARYRPRGGVERARAGSLEHFLVERYCLYSTDARGRVRRGEIHHPPWPLQAAEAELGTNTLAAAAGLRLPDREPLLHFARRLDVVAWSPERIR